MSKSRKSKRQAAGPRESGTRPLVRGWRLWGFRLLLAVGAPALLLTLAEGGLRLAGVGYPTAFCLIDSTGARYIENRKFLWQFYSKRTNLRPNPFRLARQKPAGTARIVVLGESAAAGTPDPAYNFGRMLERMLRHQAPQRRVEVVNAAMNGVNSHILLPVARDCARLEPDLFIVYMGNNEAVGLHAPGPHSGRLLGHLKLLRAGQWLRATRTGQLLAPLLQRAEPELALPQNQDAAFFERHRVAADDPRRTLVRENFQSNLVDICSAARAAGAGAVLLTVSVNLKDCPPFGSLHRTGLSTSELKRWETEYDAGAQAEATGQAAVAVGHFLAAAAIDDHFAELHYRLARCYQALEQSARTAQEFNLARDWDALAFRADSKLNELVRQTAQAESGRERIGADERKTVRLIDGERLFADAAPGGAPGENFFADHVHLNFEGNYLLAKALLPVVHEMLAEREPGVQPPQRELPTAVLSPGECAAQLAFTRINEYKCAQQMAQMTALPPFTAQLEHAVRQRQREHQLKQTFGELGNQEIQTAVEIYRAAIQLFPEDWVLQYNFGEVLLMGQGYAEAASQFGSAKEKLPHWVPIRIGLSVALAGAGKKREALQELEDALALEPESQAVKAGLLALKR